MRRERKALKPPVQPRPKPCPKTYQTLVTVYLAPDGDDSNDGFDRNKPRCTLPDLSSILHDPATVIHIIGTHDVRLNFADIEANFSGSAAKVVINNCTVLSSSAKDHGTPSSGL